MVCLGRPYPSSLQIFKGCLLQILLGPLLNTLSHTWGPEGHKGPEIHIIFFCLLKVNRVISM